MFLSPPAPYCLREMTPDDVEDVVAIERRSFPTPWPARGYQHELTQNERAFYVVLARRDGRGEEQVLGYAGQWIVADEAHVSTIAVHPDWRGHGLGALLLLQMVHHALSHDAAVVSLEVRESNETAQALYARFGFRQVGRRRRYYRDTGEDALLMDLDLTAEAARRRLEQLRRALWRRLEEEEGGDTD